MAKPALSPSRIGDFRKCRFKFRLTMIDRVPDFPSLEASRGTCIHAALEDLFDQPRDQRTPEFVLERYHQHWEKWRQEKPAEYANLELTPQIEAAAHERAKELINNYFRLENPAGLQPAARELYIDTVSSGGIRVRGFIDRVDTAAVGTRIIDYKSGKRPSEAFAAQAYFQMRFYALLWKLEHGQIPTRLQLLYLGNTDTLVIDPSEADIAAVEEEINEVWREIEAALQRQEFPPNPTRLCDWCQLKEFCPAFGGSAPPYPQEAAKRLLQINVKNEA